MRNLHILFHSGCTHLHTNQQCIRVLCFFSPLHSCQHLFLFIFLINVCLNRYEVITYCGLICISLISGFEYFSCTCWPLVCLLWENVYSDPLSFVIFLWLSCVSFLYFLNPLSDICFANILFHSIASLLIL